MDLPSDHLPSTTPSDPFPFPSPSPSPSSIHCPMSRRDQIPAIVNNNNNNNKTGCLLSIKAACFPSSLLGYAVLL